MIGEKLGYEAEQELKDYITELEKKADYTSRKIDTDLISYESSLDSNNSAFNEIQSNLEEIQRMLDGGLNRKRLAQILDSCFQEIANCI
jgi:septal ring factor EnvC (AmiA/AmiB activator)